MLRFGKGRGMGHSTRGCAPLVPALALPEGASMFMSPAEGYYNVGGVVTNDIAAFFTEDVDYGAWSPSQEELEEGPLGSYWSDNMKLTDTLRDLIKNGTTGSTIIWDITRVSGTPDLLLYWWDQPDAYDHRLEIEAMGDQGGTSGSVTSIQYNASYAGDPNYRNRINPAVGAQKVGVTVTPTTQMISCHGEDAFVRSVALTFANFNDFLLYIDNGEINIDGMTIYPPMTAAELKAATA